MHNVYAAVVEGCVSPRSTSTLPSKSQFGSTQVAMSEQALCMLISSLSCRVFAVAAPQMDGGARRHADQEQNEGQDVDQRAGEVGDRVYNRRKLFRARIVLAWSGCGAGCSTPTVQGACWTWRVFACPLLRQSGTCKAL